MTALPITKEIVYDRKTKEYAAYVTIDEGPQLIGFRKTWHDAEMLCDEYAYNYYTDNHTPEVAAAIAVEMGEEEPLAHRSITIGYDGAQCDLVSIAAQVLAPLAHLRPSIGRTGTYLLLTDMATIPVPQGDRAIVCDLIDRLNEVAAQLPARPTSITAWLHVDGEIYRVAKNGPAEEKPVEQRITPDYRDPVFPAGSNCGGEYPRR